MLCDLCGNFHLVELKVVTGLAVNLSAHQISFLKSHSHASVWVIAWKEGKYFLYHGQDVLDLVAKGLLLPPRHQSVNMEDLLELISTH